MKATVVTKFIFLKIKDVTNRRKLNRCLNIPVLCNIQGRVTERGTKGRTHPCVPTGGGRTPPLLEIENYYTSHRC